MKKLLMFFALVSFLSIDLSAQRKSKKELKIENSVNMPKMANQRNSSTRYLVFEKTSTVHYDRWYNIKHYKRDMADPNYYKYEVELQVYDGDGDLYIFGDDGGYYRQIRYSQKSGHQTEKTYYKKSDLRNHENLCYISIYGKKDTRFKIKIYKVKINGGDCIDPSKIQPNALCTSEYFPVCGCDGKTYSNKCVAEIYNGVTSYTQGPCNNNNQCIDPSRINPDAVCTLQYDPVCGCDGKTYGNSCAAEASGVTKFTQGPCNGETGRCTWDFWYDSCKEGMSIQTGSDYYVKINTKKHQDIEWMELYINGRKIRKENYYPYEWGKPNTSGDHDLKNMKQGTYKLKCVVKDKCGQYHEKYCTIYVKGNRCYYKAWYEKGKHNSRYHQGDNVYIKVKPERHQDIEWMELYVNNHKVRRENYYPYEWCKPNTSGDSALKNMRRGTYKLKCKYKTKCGKYYEEYSTIYVD